MSLWSFLWWTYKWVSNIDNRIRKWTLANAADFAAAATDNKLLSSVANGMSENIRNAPLSDFENNVSAIKTPFKSSPQKTQTNKNSDDIKVQDNKNDKSNAWGPASSWSPSTSTVSNNKTNNNMNNSKNNQSTTVSTTTNPKPVQYQPEEYEAYRQRTMSNWATYNEAYESMVNDLLNNPNKYTQEQINAIGQIWTMLWYDLWMQNNNTSSVNNTTPVVPQQNSASHDKYYASQWTPLWFIL